MANAGGSRSARRKPSGGGNAGGNGGNSNQNDSNEASGSNNSNQNKKSKNQEAKEAREERAKARKAAMPAERRQTKAYRLRWTNKPSDAAQKRNAEDYWRARLFRSSAGPPRCFSCSEGKKKMPEHNEAPTGNEEQELVPCGCPLKEAIFEEWMVEQGHLKKGAGRGKGHKKGARTELPRCLGHYRPLFVRLFEQLFGEITPQMLHQTELEPWVELLRGNFNPSFQEDEEDDEDDDIDDPPDVCKPPARPRKRKKDGDGPGGGGEVTNPITV